ncbi:hypothetical protein LTR66_012017 [Elasticomyces elasticus]|nr:hypothetical protein LTR66_012017 [Elasticomyces elasticus]
MALHSSQPFSPFAAPKLDTSTGAGRNAHLFRPPQTPATTTSTSYASAPDTGDYFSQSGRGRLRAERTHSNAFATPYSAGANDWTDVSGGRDRMLASTDAMSPGPLVNTRYQLAGGFDTPTLAATAQFEDTAMYSDTNFRRRWSDRGGPRRTGSVVDGPLARERNGRGRILPQSPDDEPDSSWSKLVLGTLGFVAGKMWSLCRDGAFRGFYAGGGKGYDLPAPYADSALGAHDSHGRQLHQPPSSYLPSEEEFLGDFEQDNTPRGPSKRLRTESGGGWVMIGSEDVRERSPRLSSRKTSSTAVPRLSTLRPTASRASSRRSLVPFTRKPSSHTSYTGSPTPHAPQSRPSTAGSTHPGLSRQASTASTRSPNNPTRSPSEPRPRPDGLQGATLTPEQQQYLSRKERQDREADKSMRNMGRQLRSLIKQGKEALGAKVGVEDVGDVDLVDEGFDEGKWEMGSGRW